jgi:hypothetical protein
VALAALFSPRDGVAPRDARAAAAFCAPLGDDVDAFWRTCTRADWMLYVAGLSAMTPNDVLPVALPWMSALGELLDGDAHEVLAAIASGDRSETLLRFESASFEHDRRVPKIARSAVKQACVVARLGDELGDERPVVWSQLALYPARALGDGFSPDFDALARYADALRRMPAPALRP